MCFFLLVSLSGLMVSCGEEPTGLFFSIEQERLIDDTNLGNELTAGTLVEFDIDNDSTDDFILAAGKIYSSVASADRAAQGDWSSRYHLDDDYLSYHVFVLNGSDLFGLFYPKNAALADSGSRLYKFNTTAGVWEMDTTDAIDTLRLEDGVQAGSYLYFTSYTLDAGGTRTYSLKAFDGTTVTDISATIESPSARLDVAVNGSEAFLVYGGLLLQSTDGGASFSPAGAASLVNFDDSKSYRGVYYSSLKNRFLLSASDGTIWYYDTDFVWKLYDDLGRETFDFQDFEYADPAVSLVVVGSSKGYYEMETGTSEFLPPAVSTSENNYLTLDFSQGVVRSLYAYSDGTGAGDDVLFALTNGYGLWSLREDGGSLLWNQE